MSIENNSVSYTILTTLIVYYIMNKFKFDYMYYGMIHTLILQLFSFVILTDINFNIFDQLIYLIFLLPIFICYFLMQLYIKYTSHKYIKLILNLREDIE